MALREGSRLGPYEILSHLDGGAMGEVYAARDSSLRRNVAVKVLPAHLADDPDRLRRLELEARAAGALNHPNILTVHDLGSHEGSPFLVTELLEGESLDRALRQGPLPWRKAVTIAAQVAEGLAAAHEKGIVHRDLKLANLFYTRDGRLKILDFGLAKLVLRSGGERDETLGFGASDGTEPGAILGTVDYMAPEQVEGEPADHRSDIFALGVCLFEMISGHRPFTRRSAAETMAAILRDEPTELREYRSDVPVSLERLIRRCLEKRREERFQSARDLAFQLSTLAQDGASGSSSRRVEVPVPQAPPSGLRKLAVRSGLLAPLALLVPLAVVASFGFPGVVAKATSDLTGQLLRSQQATAQVVAAALDYNLSAMQRRVGREASQSDLRSLLASADGPAVERIRFQALTDSLYDTYHDRHFYSWVIAHRDATVLARAPLDERVIGRSYGYREWFTGRAERAAGDLPEIVEPRRSVGLTQAFQSTAGDRPVLISVSAPVFAPGSEEVVAGVLMATLQLDTFNRWLETTETRSEDGDCPDRMALLLNRDQLVRHPCSGTLEPPIGSADFHGKPAVRELLDSESGSSSDFRDPLRPNFGSLATVARLEENSDWSVILIQDRVQALAPVEGMARRILFLGLLAVTAGMLATAGVWMLVIRWSRRRS